MKSKVMNDGSAYTRIRSQDGKKTVQFLTVYMNHEKNWDGLKEQPMPKMMKEFKEVENPMNFCLMLL